MLVFANASVAMPGVNYESTKELPQRLKDRMRSRKETDYEDVAVKKDKL